MVMEYCNLKSLRHVLDSPRILNWDLRTKLLFDCCKGMAYLHRLGYVHRDIKTENILVSEVYLPATSQESRPRTEIICKVCDFGISRSIEDKDLNGVQPPTYESMTKSHATLLESVAESRFGRGVADTDDMKSESAPLARASGGHWTLRIESTTERSELGRGRTLSNGSSETSDASSGSKYKTSIAVPDIQMYRRQSSLISQSSVPMTTLVGTVPYLAPEIIRNVEMGMMSCYAAKGKEETMYGMPADVFSFGCVVYEVITRDVIWDNVPGRSAGARWRRIKEIVLRGERPTISMDCDAAHGCPEYLTQLLESCWTEDPRERITFEDAVSFLRVSLASYIEKATRRRREVTRVQQHEMTSFPNQDNSDKRHGHLDFGSSPSHLFGSWRNLLSSA